MLIIIDKKIPEQAKIKLREYGHLLELETSGITYEAISGHPDVFFHQCPAGLIAAPNLPAKFKEELNSYGIEVIEGEQNVGEKYPASSAYNAVSTHRLLIHNFRNTDSVITRLNEDTDLIHVDQGYTRCNLLALDDDHFITSDDKIQRVLGRFEKDCLYTDPAGIILEGFKHGFIGGCCGILDNKVFIIGSLNKYAEGEKLKTYLEAQKMPIVELYDGPLFDGGSLIFLNGQ